MSLQGKPLRFAPEDERAGRRVLVYVAGPYRASNAWEVEQNVRAAEAHSLKVWEAGGVPVCPHTMTRYFDGALPDDTFLNGLIELMLRCDLVYVLPGWRKSEGTKAEIAEADQALIPVLFNFDELCESLNRLNEPALGIRARGRRREHGEEGPGRVGPGGARSRAAVDYDFRR